MRKELEASHQLIGELDQRVQELQATLEVRVMRVEEQACAASQ